MSVRILSDRLDEQAALYCSTTEIAFGPIFGDDGHHGAEERAQSFLRFLPQDARRYTDTELAAQHADWRTQEAVQWAREAAEAEDYYAGL